MGFLCIPMGYLIGTVNPSYLFARIHGEDIRKKGSGNAGASNALIIYGKLVGIFCALFDIFKAFLAIRLAQWLFPTFPLSYALTGVSCILGHVFPFYMGFRGGKGLSCLGGVIMAHDWFVFLLMLTGEILLALITNYICFVPVTASVIFPVVYALMRRDVWGGLILLIASAVIIWKHQENLKRIRKGTEARLSLIWNKEKEIERVQANQSKLEQ